MNARASRIRGLPQPRLESVEVRVQCGHLAGQCCRETALFADEDCRHACLQAESARDRVVAQEPSGGLGTHPFPDNGSASLSPQPPLRVLPGTGRPAPAKARNGAPTVSLPRLQTLRTRPSADLLPALQSPPQSPGRDRVRWPAWSTRTDQTGSSLPDGRQTVSGSRRTAPGAGRRCRLRGTQPLPSSGSRPCCIAKRAASARFVASILV